MKTIRKTMFLDLAGPKEKGGERRSPLSPRSAGLLSLHRLRPAAAPKSSMLWLKGRRAPVLPALAQRALARRAVTVTCKSRVVTVTGPRGSLTRSFKHVSVDMAFVDDGAKLRLDMWFGNPKQKAAMGTVLSHITNMITGVTQVRVARAVSPLRCASGRFAGPLARRQAHSSLPVPT